jgi:hypothetical protein
MNVWWVFKSKVPNFVYQKLSRLRVARDPLRHSKKKYLKICMNFFETSAHSANFLEFPQEIDHVFSENF